MAISRTINQPFNINTMKKPPVTITEKILRHHSDALLKRVLEVYGNRQDRRGGFESKRDANGVSQLSEFIPDTPYVVGNDEGDLLNDIHKHLYQRAKLI